MNDNPFNLPTEYLNIPYPTTERDIYNLLYRHHKAKPENVNIHFEIGWCFKFMGNLDPDNNIKISNIKQMQFIGLF